MKKRIFHGFIAALLTFACTFMYANSAIAAPYQSDASDHIEESSPIIPPMPGSPISETPEEEVSEPVITGPAAECKDTGNAVSVSENRKRGAYLGEFTTTAYCNCRQCCSGGFTLTYSGTIPKANHTISADISVYPIGTQLMIGDIIYTVEDIGGNVDGNCLDIYFETHEQALDYGRKTVDVYAVQS